LLPKVAWSKASVEDKERYKEALRTNIAEVTIPYEALLCQNICCCDRNHKESLDMYFRHLSEACLLAGEEHIPITCSPYASGVPGWTEYVAPVRHKSLFWHKIWVDNDRPRIGIIADIMRRTRAQYHNAVRAVIRNRADLVNKRFAEAISENCNRDFWREVKKMRKNKSCYSNRIDDRSSPADIADMFASKFNDLYVSVAYDQSEMIAIRETINYELLSEGYNKDCVISANDIHAAISKLKTGKNDGHRGLSSDYFINACYGLSVHMAFLFSSLLVHGFVPRDMSLSTIIPIPKGKNVNLSSSANYRGITLGSMFGKIFDSILLSRLSDRLQVCDLQFGFQPKRSTDMCTMLLKEAIAYYISNDSPVYCIMLDATKAFDRVDYCKLFRDVIKRKLPAVCTRFMLNLYTDHFSRVLWNGMFSDTFKVLNGVKQGAVISPILFCVYIDGLLCRLRDSGIGCVVGDIFLGALAYADDISLLAPTPSGARKLLTICEDYAEEYNIKFNGNKSKCLYVSPARYRVSSSSPNPSFTIQGQHIDYVSQWPHLGHILMNDIDDREDIMFRRNSLCRQINNVLCFFVRRYPLTKLKLLISFCYSFYGSVLWDLSNPCVENLCRTWRKGLRRALELPADTHRKFLPEITGTLPIFDELVKRTATFIQSCMSSDNKTVNAIANMAVFSLRMLSPIGRNAFFVVHGMVLLCMVLIELIVTLFHILLHVKRTLILRSRL
jgi:hypothetical protein